MIKMFRICFLIVGTLAAILGTQPFLYTQTFQPVQFRIVGNASPGYIMVDSPLRDSAAFLDHSGNWLHRFAAKSIKNFQLQPDGTFTGFVNGDAFNLWNSNFEKIAELRADGYPTDFHDVKVLPGDKYLVLGTEYRAMDLSTVVSGGRTDAIVQGFVLQERTLSGQTLWTWKSLDNIPPTDATHNIDLTQKSVSYIHPNHLFVDADGNIMVSCRHLDRIIKIDRQTGTILWSLGGSKARTNDFTWLNDTRDGFTGFSHQHSVSRTASGDLMVFDNANLNPRQVSRVAIYRLNEVDKTIERLWQFEHPFGVYSGSMGSAVELPNGNILISWGNNLAGALVSEVTRAGDLVLDLFSPATNGFQTYRAEKTLFRMAGSQRTLLGPSTTEFAEASGTTHLTVTVTSITKPTVVTVERHKSVSPFGLLPNPEPCRYLPVRWCIRSSDPEAIKGTIRLDLGAVPDLQDVTEVSVYHRPIEGLGLWNVLPGSFDETTKVFTSTAFATGEYVVGSKVCFVPRLLEPVFGQERVVPNARLAWSTAKNTEGYQIQLATSLSFSAATKILDVTTISLHTTTPTLESLTEYFWRVRAINDAGPGDWSSIGRFRTTIGRPSLLSPVYNGLDTVSVPTDATLQWTPVNRANSYRVRIRSLDMPNKDLFADTTGSAGTTIRGLAPNTWYTWQVHAANDSIVGAWSVEGQFLTSPGTPTGLLPPNGTVTLDSRLVHLAWQGAPGAIGYTVRVAKQGTSEFIVNQDIVDTNLVLRDLQGSTLYVWMVRARGRHGNGTWTREVTFSTAGLNFLGSAQLLLPRRSERIETAPVNFSWSLVTPSVFTVVVSQDSLGFDVVYESDDVIERSISIPYGTLENSRSYYWRVIARSVSDGNTSVSEVRPFDYFASGPIVVGLRPVSPFDGAHNVPIEGTLVFTRDSRVNAYRVQMFDDRSTPVLALTVNDTTLSYVGLRRAAFYTWRVIGLRGGVPIDTGSVARFHTELDVVNSIGAGRESEVPIISFNQQQAEVRVSCEPSQTECTTTVYMLDGTAVARQVHPSIASIALRHLPIGVYVVVTTSPTGSATLVVAHTSR